ncbi:DDE-type integrase/transposase/recombinase, partial [Bacillus cereus]|uniref:DDE-type integrase/transposase/recombinase n=1 Tax=Bacillus cereus TaxID=1396 RepID=UPI002B24295B
MNKGNKYLLTVIDTFSKFAWALPLKAKTGTCVTEAFKTIFRESGGRRPRFLHTDKGKEFYNAVFQKFIRKHNVQHYSTFSDVKASIVERFNRTLKTHMWKRFTLRGNYKWVDILPELVDTYNHTRHRTIRMKPADVTKSDEQRLISTVYCPKYTPTTKKAKYKIG